MPTSVLIFSNPKFSTIFLNAFLVLFLCPFRNLILSFLVYIKGLLFFVELVYLIKVLDYAFFVTFNCWNFYFWMIYLLLKFHLFILFLSS